MAFTPRSRNTVDSITQIDLNTVTVEDMLWMYGTFQPFSTGSGRDKKHFSRSGVQTPIGDIKLSLWNEVMEYIAIREEEVWLVDALTKLYTERNYSKVKPAELRQEALESYSRRIFDEPQWVYFLEFNRRFRPEVLEATEMAYVICECCKKPGEIPQKQIVHAYQEKVCCPHCGRSSRYFIVSSLDWPWIEF